MPIRMVRGPVTKVHPLGTGTVVIGEFSATINEEINESYVARTSSPFARQQLRNATFVRYPSVVSAFPVDAFPLL